jgi:gamma-glutamylputrescine oxidase
MGDHPLTYYEATARRRPAGAPLEGRVEAEVCVVGGGFTGVSTLLHLAERGHDAVLLEAERIGFGASGRNGGQVGSGQRVEQPTLERWFGAAKARQLWQLAEDAKGLVKELVARHAIACDLKPGILDAAHSPAEARALRQHALHLSRHYDYPHARYIARDELRAMLGSERYHGGLLDSDACHLHPLNYLLGLPASSFFERSRVIAIDIDGERVGGGVRVGGQSVAGVPAPKAGAGVVVHTAHGRVEARRLVLATNGYLGRLMPDLAGWIMPIDNFILATEPLGEARARALIRDDVAVADTKFVIDYYRLSADGRLLFGGGESLGRTPADLKGFIRRHMLRVFPQLADVAIDHAWSGTLAITRNRLPHFWRSGDQLYVAHGYSGHGVAMATLAGQLIADAIDGDPTRFDLMAELGARRFPGGTHLRRPALIAGMLYYGLRDRF